MEARGVQSAVAVLSGTDLTVADHTELASSAKAVARLQAFVDHAKVQIARRGKQLAAGGNTSSNHVLIDEGRCTGNDAKATNGRDRVCDDLPDFESALATGGVTGAHLDALARHTKSLSDEEQADLARSPTSWSPTHMSNRLRCSTARSRHASTRSATSTARVPTPTNSTASGGVVCQAMNRPRHRHAPHDGVARPAP